MASEPLRVGLIVGREWSFPPAFIEEVNSRDQGVVAEYIKLGAPHMDDPARYRVIIDRISHEVPFYRTYLKHAALQGATIVNNPFMWTADDKFFGATLATSLGLASPQDPGAPQQGVRPRHRPLRESPEPGLSVGLAGGDRLRRAPLYTQGRPRRRLEGSLRLQEPGGTALQLRPVRASHHDRPGVHPLG